MYRFIFAFSKSRRDVAADLEQKTKPCIIHLAKLWNFPNSQYTKHWRKEVYNLYKYVDSFKGSHKYPNKDFIFDNTFGSNSKILRKLEDIALFDEEDLIPDEERLSDYSGFSESVNMYFDWLSYALSKYKVVSFYEVEEKLKEFGF